jgi:hypothetical protein
MSSKTKIAVFVAALFLGAQAGIAALEQDPSIASAETTAPTEQQAEATQPAATEAPQAAAEQPAAEAPAAAPARITHVPLSKTFPRSPDGSDMLPGLAAYLDRLDASRSHLVARGDAFPGAAEGGSELAPGTVAYFDQRDRARIARAQEQQRAAEAQAAAPTAEAQPTAPVALAPQESPSSSN